MSVYSFMESQIEVLLQEVRSSSDSSGPGAREIAAGTTGSRLITAGQRLGASGSQKGRRKQWYQALAEHVKENHVELAGQANRMARHIEALRLVRNVIVHRAGFFPRWQLGRKQWLPGIFSLQGTVFVSQQGEETLQKLARDTTDLLCKVAGSKEVSSSWICR